MSRRPSPKLKAITVIMMASLVITQPQLSEESHPVGSCSQVESGLSEANFPPDRMASYPEVPITMTGPEMLGGYGRRGFQITDRQPGHHISSLTDRVEARLSGQTAGRRKKRHTTRSQAGPNEQQREAEENRGNAMGIDHPHLHRVGLPPVGGNHAYPMPKMMAMKRRRHHNERCSGAENGGKGGRGKIAVPSQ